TDLDPLRSRALLLGRVATVDDDERGGAQAEHLLGNLPEHALDVRRLPIRGDDDGHVVEGRLAVTGDEIGDRGVVDLRVFGAQTVRIPGAADGRLRVGNCGRVGRLHGEAGRLGDTPAAAECSGLPRRSPTEAVSFALSCREPGSPSPTRSTAKSLRSSAL